MISRPTEVLKFRVGYLVIPGKAEEVGGGGGVTPSTGFSFCVSDSKAGCNDHSLILEKGYSILL